MPKYGLISEIDGKTIEKTLDLLIDEVGDFLEITEVGLFDCGTGQGIHDYLQQKGIRFHYTGIDSEKDKPINPPSWMEFINADSKVAHQHIENNSQHFIFIDGCHCLDHVISDVFSFSKKVKVGGFLLFHDTGQHIAEKKDFQHGDPSNPDCYISVRKALTAFGLFDEKDAARQGFKLIFDEADHSDEAGGVSVFRKLF